MIRPVYIEGGLYTLIAFGTQIYELLAGDEPLSGRTITAGIAKAVVAGAIALKAFLSTSYSRATGDAILVHDLSARPASDPTARPAPAFQFQP